MASVDRWRGAIAAALCLLIAGCGNKGPQGGPPPPEVGIVTVTERPVPIELTYMARTAGVREVEVRARVSGILQRRLYTEGLAVKEGDLLFRIDPAPYAAEVERARAQVAVEQARASEALRQKERSDPLVAQGVVSKREYDEAVSDAASTDATLGAAKAALRRAQLDLGYTEVRAPITGLTSREARSEGSLVNSGDETALLTRISQTDQLYVEFAMPVNEAALVRSAIQTQQNGGAGGGAECRGARSQADRIAEIRRYAGRSDERHRAGARDDRRPCWVEPSPRAIRSRAHHSA